MLHEFINEHPLRRIRALCTWIGLGAVFLLVASCSRPEQPQAAYVPISQLEQSYGRLITVSNEPTPDQHGTGDRLGLFRDERGPVWGIPLTIGDDGSVLGCEIVGATNEPNGWRGGTGKLELLLRDAQGGLRWHSVASVEIKTGPLCLSQSPPVIPLKYYRLVKAGAGK